MVERIEGLSERIARLEKNWTGQETRNNEWDRWRDVFVQEVKHMHADNLDNFSDAKALAGKALDQTVVNGQNIAKIISQNDIIIARQDERTKIMRGVMWVLGLIFSGGLFEWAAGKVGMK